MTATSGVVEQQSNYTLSDTSFPILNNHPTHGTNTINGWSSVLFGIPFMAAGAWIGLLAADVIPGQKAASVPDWALGIFASFFFFGGLFICVVGVRGNAQRAAYVCELATQPSQRWLYDFQWRQEGISFSAFNAMLQRLMSALMWTAFLAPFFWIGLHIKGQKPFAIVAVVFGLLSLILWYRWAQMLLDYLRYGNSFLSFDAFPFFLGGKLRVRLRAPSSMSSIEELTLTLRCVREGYSRRGGREDREIKVCYELYRAQATIQRDQLAGFEGREIPAEFPLPSDQPATTLAATVPTYWEIEANGKASGVDYQAYFLVPVYANN